MNRLIHWPKMWWRRRGFGVHSPFAFSLITRTIAERGEYYAYKELRPLAGKDFGRFSLYFRLLCRFKPTTVSIFSADSRLEKVTRLADSRISFAKDNPDMIVVESLSSDREVDEVFNTISSSDNHNSYILLFNISSGLNSKLWSLLNEGNLPLGMTFTDGRTAILCLSSNLPRQVFKLLF